MKSEKEMAHGNRMVKRQLRLKQPLCNNLLKSSKSKHSKQTEQCSAVRPEEKVVFDESRYVCIFRT